MKRIKLKGGDEFDVFSKSRRVIIPLSRSGVCKAIKRKYNKRFRKVGKSHARASV